MSGGVALVGKLDAPEILGGMEDLDAEFEGAGNLLILYRDDAKFAHLAGKAVQNLQTRANGRPKRQAQQCAIAADGDDFGGSFAGVVVCRFAAYDGDGNTNGDAARTTAFQHSAGSCHSVTSSTPRPLETL